MNKEKLKRATILGLAAVTAVNTVNAGIVFAEEDASKASEDSGESEGGKLPEQEQVSKDEIAIVASLEGGKIVGDKLISAGNLSLRVGASVLKEGYSITNLVLGKRTEDGTGPSDAEILEGNEGSFSLAGYKNEDYDLYTVTVFLSNGQQISFDIADLVEDLANITGHIEDTVSPVAEFLRSTWRESNGYINGDGTAVFKVLDGESGIASVSAVLNGGEFEYYYDESSGELSFSTDGVPEGNHKVTISMEDVAGNVGSFEYEFKIMRMAPEITGASHSVCVNSDGVSYYRGTLDMSFGGCDHKDIESITVKSEDGSWSESVDLGTGSVSVSENGRCVVVVRDVAGNERVYRLSELFEEMEDEITEDSEIPVAVIEEVSSSESGWYGSVDDVIVKLKMSDNIGISVATVTVNGVEKNVSYAPEEGSFSLNLSEFDVPEDGVYVVSFVCSDRVGNTSEEQTLRVSVDTVAPVVEVEDFKSTYKEKDGKLYVKDSIAASLSISDTLSGVKEVVLMKGNDVVQTIEEGKLLVSVDGEGYKVKATDFAGNQSIIPVEELLGLPCGDFVFDRELPSVSADLNGSEENLGKWVTGSGMFACSVSDDTIIDSLVITVNGEELEQTVSGSKNKVYLDLLSNPSEDGIYNISVVCKDIVGNTVTKEYKAMVDMDSPSVQNFDVEGVKKVLNGKLYIKGDLSISADVDDETSGIKSVELLNSGEVVATELPFVISEDGEYSIRVADNVGLVTEKSLQELMGEDFDSVIADNDAPSVNLLINGGNLTEDWTVEDAVISVNLRDNVSLSSVTVDVNGDKRVETLSGANDSVEVNLKDYERADDGLYVVTVSAVDFLGNKTEDLIYTVKADFDSPAINSIHTEGEYIEAKGCVYVNGSLKLDCVSSDIGSGVDRVELVNDGVVVSESDSSLSITTSGEYAVRVVDGAGLVTEYRLEELLGTETSRVIVDRDKPSVEVSVNDSPVEETWVTGEAVLKIVMKDSSGLSSAKVWVNNAVSNHSFNGDTEGEVSIDLKTLKRPDNGEYRVKVESEDILGNKSGVYECTVKADFDHPSLGSIEAKGNIVEYKGNVYLDGSIVVSGAAEDVGSGVKSVELLRGSDVVASKLPFRVFENGSYRLRITDNAGLVTIIGLNDLLGTKSNTIIQDSTVPSVSRKAGFKPDYVRGKENWYKSYPDIQYTIKDDNLKNVKITLNGKDRIKEVSGSVYKVNTSGITGKVTLKVVAEDCYGHKSEDSYVYHVDRSAPKFGNASFSEKYKSFGGHLFFKANPTLVVSAEDAGVGIKEFTLTSGGSKEVFAGSSTAQFKLRSGKYSVEVKDHLGNASGKVELKDLVKGISTNSIIVDKFKPTVSVKKPKGRVSGWYNKDVVFDITAKDNQGINSATVKINGKVVSSFKASKVDIKSKALKADTSKVKPEKDGLYRVEVEVLDNAGNKKSWSDSFHIDKKAPKVEKFVFTGKGVQEGKEIKGGNSYGFYFDGKASCEIFVSDSAPSSGLDKLYVSIASDRGGGATLKEYPVVGGSVKVELPENFKGMITAHASDKAGNVGKEAKPDMVLTEDSNCFINNTGIDISLPDVVHTDMEGHPLYAGDVSVSANVHSTFSGIRTLEWGVGDEVVGSVVVNNDGSTVGDTADVTQKDRNLVVNLLKGFNVSGNANSLEVWVKVRDRVGHESKNSAVFSIDKDIPVISVDYNASGSEYYNQTRVATIHVKERNFDPAQFRVTGNGGILGSWSNSGDEWVASMSFEDDGEYQFGLECTDRAGNNASPYASEHFVIDKTAPAVSVSWNNNETVNDGYYNQKRIASVTVTEKYFDPGKISVETEGSVSSWTSNGDVHSATVTFDGSGEYNLKVSGQDAAGNSIQEYSSGSFIIDTEAPSLTIEGVDEGVSYKQDAGFRVNVSDKYLDPNQVSVSLVGKKNGEVEVKGTLNDTTGEFVFSEFPKEEKYDDIYTLKASAKDRAGNDVEKSVIFSVNRFGSSYEFLEGNLLNQYLKSAKSVTITESNVDRLDMSKVRVEVLLDGKKIDVPENCIEVSEKESKKGKYKYNYFIDKSAFTKDGKYLIQVYSCSKDGTEYSSISEEYAFVLDTTPPEVIVSGVASSSKYYEYERNVTIDVRDLSGIKELKVVLNGEVVTPSKEKGIYSLKIKESSGKQNLSVEAYDAAGNVSVVEIKDFMISSSLWVYLINQVWFKLGIGAAFALLLALIGMIINSRRKVRKKEEEALREHAEMYHSSSSSSTLGTDTKDEAQDLDK